jgi:hypothetical protein
VDVDPNSTGTDVAEVWIHYRDPNNGYRVTFAVGGGDILLHRVKNGVWTQLGVAVGTIGSDDSQPKDEGLGAATAAKAVAILPPVDAHPLTPSRRPSSCPREVDYSSKNMAWATPLLLTGLAGIFVESERIGGPWAFRGASPFGRSRGGLRSRGAGRVGLSRKVRPVQDLRLVPCPNSILGTVNQVRFRPHRTRRPPRT